MDLSNPLGLEMACRRAGFAADDHPLDPSDVQIGQAFK
ncbi:hypothetical protein DB32_003254 [Sandaracinus amylolyticus]|uniref:Uncharacterized protein n=1 Tax=Sandaracinus amylolyticus TaxID=927083 RepID=A0A0F6W308_9BACT|nr:hypothetical protein DB32_003254 [Sandaracinus amylolyticus]